MKYSNLLSIVVLSCDDYSDLWDTFFLFKERYWPDCPYRTYLVNDTKEYNKDGVTVLNIGKVSKWSTRVRSAIERIPTPYVCPILDDHFIIKNVCNERIKELLSMVEVNKFSYLALEPRSIITPKSEREYFLPKIAYIPKHQKYGINTSAAIWKKVDYLECIGQGDYSPWQFEVNMCNLAKTTDGLPGINLVDERNSLQICEKEVVRQGVYLPNAIKHIHKVTGVKIDTTYRGVMSYGSLLIDIINGKASKMRYGKRILKAVAKFFGRKFFTED